MGFEGCLLSNYEIVLHYQGASSLRDLEFKIASAVASNVCVTDLQSRLGEGDISKREHHLRIFARAMYMSICSMMQIKDPKYHSTYIFPRDELLGKFGNGTWLLRAPLFWVLTRWILTSAAIQFEPIHHVCESLIIYSLYYPITHNTYTLTLGTQYDRRISKVVVSNPCSSDTYVSCRVSCLFITYNNENGEI